MHGRLNHLLLLIATLIYGLCLGGCSTKKQLGAIGLGVSGKPKFDAINTQVLHRSYSQLIKGSRDLGVLKVYNAQVAKGLRFLGTPDKSSAVMEYRGCLNFGVAIPTTDGESWGKNSIHVDSRLPLPITQNVTWFTADSVQVKKVESQNGDASLGMGIPLLVHSAHSGLDPLNPKAGLWIPAIAILVPSYERTPQEYMATPQKVEPSLRMRLVLLDSAKVGRSWKGVPLAADFTAQDIEGFRANTKTQP